MALHAHRIVSSVTALTTLLVAGCGNAGREAVPPPDTVTRLWQVAPQPAAAPRPRHVDTLVGPTTLCVTWTTYDLPAGAPVPMELRAHPGGEVMPQGQVDALLRQQPSLRTTMILLSGQTAQTSFLTQYTFIADYSFQREQPDPQIAALTFGHDGTVLADAVPGGVRILGLRSRSLELEGVQTWVGTLATATGIRAYPWEEPTCLAWAEDYSGPAVTLRPQEALVIPARYWVERPSPSVRSHAITLAPQAGSADAIGSPGSQQVLVITAVVVRPDPDHPAHEPPTRSLLDIDLDDPVRALTPPWRQLAVLGTLAVPRTASTSIGAPPLPRG